MSTTDENEVKRRGREHIRKPPGEYYRNVYLDIVSPSAQAMRYAYEFSRPDRLLVVSGSGNLDFRSSVINELDLHISGNAQIDAEPVTAQRAEIHISGNGRIQVRAQQFLKVRISGNGEVHYWGNPNTDVEVSGNGKAIRH